MTDGRPQIVGTFASGGIVPGPVGPFAGEPGGPPLERPIAVQISQAEQDHHAALRRRSYELAVARGHINRFPS